MTTPPNQPTFLCFHYSWRVLRQVIPLFVVACWLLHFFLFTHLIFYSLFVLQFSVLFDIQMLQFLSGQVYDHTIAREPIKEL